MSKQLLIELNARAENKCELCGSDHNLEAYEVTFARGQDADAHALLCENCRNQLDGETALDVAHWHCLNGSAWSVVPAVQVLSYRQLKALGAEAWAEDLLEQMYLDEETLVWAEEGVVLPVDPAAVGDRCVDCNGALLVDGDSVTIIKNLDVKGSSLVAKRGTAVRNIRLTDDPTHVEGRVNGMAIYLKTCFLKKSN